MIVIIYLADLGHFADGAVDDEGGHNNDDDEGCTPDPYN